MVTKLYVGNLPTDVSREEIRTLFAQAGEVGKISLARDHETMISKGVAFVVMSTEAGQVEAIKRFNGYSMGEKILSVRAARIRPNRLRSGREEKNRGNSSETV